MFSGIVEAVSSVISTQPGSHVTRIRVQRPPQFTDIKAGDSIAVDGICLTVEEFDSESIQFALGYETLRLLDLTPEKLYRRRVNLERSLRWGDRVHGHMVTGHVEGLGQVQNSQSLGESWLLTVRLPDTLKKYFWPKGGITLNGVSLTVNQIEGSDVSVCLIPETIQRTNLAELKNGDIVNIEPDVLAKAVSAMLGQQLQGAPHV